MPRFSDIQNIQMYSTNKIAHYIIFFVLLFALSFCASPVAPKGGAKDERPPQLIKEKSTPNFKTNFTKQDIKLTFDEWIELKDVFNQIVISPPLTQKDYEVKIKGKSLIFHFKGDAQLHENATYTINFGEAVRDITEKNPAKNLRYVFSTGSYIDSLTVRGHLVDVLSGEPIEDALFMLYENLADSVVRTQRPFYFGKSDKTGNFFIENVKAGTFKGFALKDADLNYLFNNPSEMLGFPDSYIILGDSTNISTDSTEQTRVKPVVVPDIRMFKEAQPLYISDVDSSYQRHLKLSFNRSVKGLDLEYPALKSPPIIEYDKDTLHLWYEQNDTIDWQLLVKKDSLLNDTIPVRIKEGKKAKLQYISKKSSTSGKLRPNQKIKIAFSQPLAQFDTAFIHLKEDTTATLVQPSFAFDTIAKRQLWLTFRWKESKVYDLEILPGGVKDIFGVQNLDTIRLKNIAEPLKSYGNIVLTFKNLKDSTAYVCYLLDKNDGEVATFRMYGPDEFQYEKTILPPGNYHLRIVIDLNNNGKWDSGNYNARLQPEPLFEKAIEQLRANWDVEMEVDLSVFE